MVLNVLTQYPLRPFRLLFFGFMLFAGIFYIIIAVSTAGSMVYGYVASVFPYAEGCDLSCTYSNVIVHDRPQPWAFGYFLFAYHISVYI